MNKITITMGAHPITRAENPGVIGRNPIHLRQAAIIIGKVNSRKETMATDPIGEAITKAIGKGNKEIILTAKQAAVGSGKAKIVPNNRPSASKIMVAM
jgi:hypothetical protein